jgi:hypothetical protein
MSGGSGCDHDSGMINKGIKCIKTKGVEFEHLYVKQM